MLFGPPRLPTSKQNWQKSVPRPVKIQAQIWSASWSFFDGFWDQLGSMLGRFWWPSWSHFGTKWHQNPTPKPIKKTTAFWKASGTNLNQFFVDLGSNLGGGPTNRLFGDLLALGAKMRPRPLQEPHKTPQEPPRAQFWWIFDGYVVHFCLIFGWFLYDFWSIFQPTSGFSYEECASFELFV